MLRITEDIITELSRFARKFKLPVQGKCVRYPPSGAMSGASSVRWGSDRLRNSAADRCRDRGHRWAEHYDRKLDDIFAV